MRHKQGKYGKWYRTPGWYARREHQLKLEPFCKMCLDRGIATMARVADHVIPHGGNYNKFRLGAIQSLCFECHDSRKRMIDLHGFENGVDAAGWPTDPRHPTNVRMRATA